MKIIILDRDTSYAKALRYFLQEAGHQVFITSEASSLPEMIKGESPDLLLVEQGIMEIGGTRPFTAIPLQEQLPFVIPIKHAEQKPSDAKAQEGADSSPLYTEVHQRLAETFLSKFRQLRKGTVSAVRVGCLSLNLDRKHVQFCGKPLSLTPLEFKLLSVLTLNAGYVVSYQELLEQVWGREEDGESGQRPVKVHIKHIRRKMQEVAPDAKPYIHAVRGFGYMLNRPSKDEAER